MHLFRFPPSKWSRLAAPRHFPALLRGDYKQSDYGKVVLPFTVLRRLDCVRDETKDAVLAEKAKREKAGLNPEPFLRKKSGQLFYNTPPLDLKKLMGDQDHIGEKPLQPPLLRLLAPRPLAPIDAELKACTDKILAMIGGLTK